MATYLIKSTKICNIRVEQISKKLDRQIETNKKQITKNIVMKLIQDTQIKIIDFRFNSKKNSKISQRNCFTKFKKLF